MIPDHTRIIRFRALHQDAFVAVSAQLAATTGLAKFETVAIDGTKRRGARGAGRGVGRAGLGRRCVCEDGDPGGVLVDLLMFGHRMRRWLRDQSQ